MFAADGSDVNPVAAAVAEASGAAAAAEGSGEGAGSAPRAGGPVQQAARRRATGRRGNAA